MGEVFLFFSEKKRFALPIGVLRLIRGIIVLAILFQITWSDPIKIKGFTSCIRLKLARIQKIISSILDDQKI